MKLANEYSFLSLEYTADGSSSHTVSILPSLKNVFPDWAASTRVSPIFGINGLGTASTSASDFRGDWFLTFLGPLHPEKILECYEKKWKVWLTLGIFNLLVLNKTNDEKKRLLKWARDANIECETWTIKNGRVLRLEVTNRKYKKSLSWRRQVSKLYNARLAPELTQAVKDYCPVIATALARSEKLPAGIFADLNDINQFIVDDLGNRDHESEEGAPYPTLGQLLTIHAGLTRFTSQTFSGTARIYETECHLRGHSLLGIGVASIALAHLTEFIQSTIGAARLAERFAALASVKTEIPDLCELRIREDFWRRDHLGEVKLADESDISRVPLLSFFSARDGFKSTLTTISAPLSTISSCNSLRWSLLTITHELSHVLIRSILAELYPDLESERAIAASLELLEKGGKGSNLLEEIKRLLLITIVQIDNVSASRIEPLEIDSETIVILLEQWYREVQEILVHVFDFLYFYGGEIDKYVEGIWVSWGTIPNIKNRIREYVVRTICTALVNHLERANAEEMARDQVLRCLKKMRKDGTGGMYVKRALKYIADHWDDEILPRVVARKDLVKIARAFLFSATIATAVRRETTGLGGGEPSEKEGYTLKSGYLELKEISNPFHFLEMFTKSKRPSAVESAWMLYVLAYCVNYNAS
jgi:hypothetical protein